MVYKVLLTEIAEMDLDEAIFYYASINDYLMFNFFNDYRSKITDLSFNPLYFSFYEEGFRRLRFTNFPYVLIYKVDQIQNIVIVHSIAYGGRDPDMIHHKITDQ